MGGKIFVNYRRDDSAPHALNIAQYLESRFGKNSVFIDIDRIRAGQNFPDVLEDKLAFCKVMLSVIGPKWLDAKNEKTGGRRIDNPDDWVRLEIEQALARGVTVVPVLVAGARLPSKDELPDTLKRLVEHQVATITTNGFRHEMAGLANDIADVVGRRRRWPAVAVGVGLFGIAIIAAATWLDLSLPWTELSRSSDNQHASSFAASTEQPATIATGPSSDQISAPYAAERGAPQHTPLTEEEKLAQYRAEAQRQLDASRAAEQAAAERGMRDQAIERQKLALLKEQDDERKKKRSEIEASVKTFRDCPACPEMVEVPSGSFTMGSLSDPTEQPPHEVTIAKGFAIGRYEVTWNEWELCVADGSCKTKTSTIGKRERDRQPILGVGWHEVTQQFMPWLSRKSGKTYRLPSEAEWEYAARAGTTTKYAFGDTLSRSQAQFAMAGYPSGNADVGSFHPNAFGLYDMHGNVGEWVADCYHKSYDGAPIDGSAWTTDCETFEGEPTRLSRGAHHQPDGASVAEELWSTRSASRLARSPLTFSGTLGFRVVRDL